MPKKKKEKESNKNNKPIFVMPPKELTFDELCDEIENDSGDWIHDPDMGDR